MSIALYLEKILIIGGTEPLPATNDDDKQSLFAFDPLRFNSTPVELEGSGLLRVRRGALAARRADEAVVVGGEGEEKADARGPRNCGLRPRADSLRGRQ